MDQYGLRMSTVVGWTVTIVGFRPRPPAPAKKMCICVQVAKSMPAADMSCRNLRIFCHAGKTFGMTPGTVWEEFQIPKLLISDNTSPVNASHIQAFKAA